MDHVIQLILVITSDTLEEAHKCAIEQLHPEVNKWFNSLTSHPPYPNGSLLFYNFSDNRGMVKQITGTYSDCTHPDHNNNEKCLDRTVGCSRTCVCCMGDLALKG